MFSKVDHYNSNKMLGFLNEFSRFSSEVSGLLSYVQLLRMSSSTYQDGGKNSHLVKIACTAGGHATVQYFISASA